MASKIRLHVAHPLAQGQTVPLSDAQAHYLFGVMRLGVGAVISLFNGRDGEWDGAVVQAGKRAGMLAVQGQTAPLMAPPDLWLLFAPVKKARTDMIVEKAVELGVARIVPVLTDHTNAERLRTDKMCAHVIEAAEQCGATHVPDVAAPQKLASVLGGWPAGRDLWFCDETRRGDAAGDAVGRAANAETGRAAGAVLIGPEGGFSPAERAHLATLPFATGISLGPRILRAETAAIAALTLWQVTRGDWR